MALETLIMPSKKTPIVVLDRKTNWVAFVASFMTTTALMGNAYRLGKEKRDPNHL